MATILVISFTDLKKDPRVRRQLEALRFHYSVIAAGAGDPNLPNVRFIPCVCGPRTFGQKVREGVELLLCRYEAHYWRKNHVQQLKRELEQISFDAIIANDLEALPLALSVADRRPVIFDAHEYSPREFEERLAWRIFNRRSIHYFCDAYLPRTTRMMTVADGIADEYRRVFGIKSIVVPNAAFASTLSPRSTSAHAVRMIHHGHAMPTRQLENMIDVMPHLEERFELDLMLVPGDPQYLERLKRKAGSNRRVRILPPVSAKELIPFSNNYDIGMYLLCPSSFNNLHALPNKFFEFLQARLAIAIGPSPEMARIVKEFGCGVIAKDFSPVSLAGALNRLSPADIDLMKAGSDRAACVYTAERNASHLREIVATVLKEA